MTLGSHNTMTYLKPRKWWQWFGRFIAKCQKLPIEEQYEKGARWFDIRISIPMKNGEHTEPIFSHGLVDYKGKTPAEVFKFLGEHKDTYCRIVLEKGGEKEEDLFKFYVMSWMNIYGMNVTQVARKGVWQNIIEPNAECPYGPCKDLYASCNGDYPQYQNLPGILRSKTWSGYIIDGLWPWIYAKLNNKKNLKKYKNEKITLLIDFIGL